MFGPMYLSQVECLVSCSCQRENSHLSNTVPKPHPKAKYFIISLTSLSNVAICLCQIFTQNRKKWDMTVTCLALGVSDLLCIWDKNYPASVSCARRLLGSFRALDASCGVGYCMYSKSSVPWELQAYSLCTQGWYISVQRMYPECLPHSQESQTNTANSAWQNF